MTPEHDDEHDLPFALMRDIAPQKTEWLWDARVPLGELTLIEGDPSTNKSCITLDLAARVSVGGEMPDGRPTKAGGVLLLCGEDSLPKTIQQRLEAAGADMNRVAAVTKLLTIPDDLPIIEAMAFRIAARLVVIDPVMVFLGPNAGGDQAVRRALTPLKAFAERNNVAVILVRHLTKSSGRNPLYRGSGSIGITAAARSVLLAAPDPEDPHMRVLCHLKSSLSEPAPSLLFEPVSVADSVVVRWRGECSYGPLDLLNPSSGHGEKLEWAQELLLDLLKDGPVPQTEIVAKAAELGISFRTVERAKAIVGVVSRRSGFGPGGVVLWDRPAEEPHTPPNADWRPIDQPVLKLTGTDTNDPL